MESKNRNCLNCGNTFLKHKNVSKKEWIKRSKFCCKKCGSDFRKGKSIKHEGQFKKGQKAWNLGLTRETDKRVKKYAETKTKNKKIDGEYVDKKGERVRDFKYRMWRSKVFQRDNWTCQTCHLRSYVEVHHIQKWAKYPKLRFDVNNGITLCKECHKLTDNYRNKYYGK